MRHPLPIHAFVLGCTLFGTPAWSDDRHDPRPVDAPSLGAEPPHNLCLGGLDDRKLILPENQIRNPFRETTHLGCEVEGGKPTVMPDLPPPQPVRTVLG
jgi:hypothetical protein